VVQRSIVEGFPQADISVSIVWVNMLPEDTEANAERSALVIDDPRVRHFHDRARRSGQAIAASLGWKDYVAWDIYLFYESGSTWLDGPPAPAHFAHQLPRDSTHFRTGDDLVRELREAMKRLTAARG
jgi:hypothetical protein